MTTRRGIRRIAGLAGFLLCILLSAAPAVAEKRVALVVGNNTYANLPSGMQLRNAVSDARAVRDTLKGLGFDVLYSENVDRKALVDRLSDFTARLNAGDLAFFFFAGHGVSFSGANFLLPSDVPVPRGSGRAEEGRLADQAIAETQIIERITGAGARVAIVVIDACRDNPLQASDRRSLGSSRGLVPSAPARGVFSIYSAGFGQAALDRLGPDDRNPNSVFTRVFIDKLKTPGLDLKVVATETRRAVATLAEKAGHEQFPAYYDQIIGGDVYLAGLPQALAAPAVVPVPPAPVPDSRAETIARQERDKQEREKRERAKLDADALEKRRRDEEAGKAREEAARVAREKERLRGETEKQKVAIAVPATPEAVNAPAPMRTLRGHTADVRVLAFSPDGRWLASGSNDQTARLWDVVSGRLVHTTPKHKFWLSNVAFSRDGGLWASSVGSDRLYLWDTASGKQVRVIGAKTPTVIAFLPDAKHLLSNLIFDMAVFEIATGKVIREFNLGLHVEKAALSPDGGFILALTRNPATGLTEPRLYNAATGVQVRQYPDHKWTQTIAMSPDGRRVATGGDDKIVRVLETETGREIWARTTDFDVRSVAFSPDGRRLAMSTYRGFEIRNAETGEVLRVFKDFPGLPTPRYVIFSPDGRQLAAALDNTIGIFDVGAEAPATVRQ